MVFRNGYSTSVVETKGGRYKVMWRGQADGHISDWAGTNYRFTPVQSPVAEIQPRLGFATIEEANALQARITWVFRKNCLDELTTFERLVMADYKRAQHTGGSYVSEDRIYG